MSGLTGLFGEDAAILRERNFQLILLINVFPAVGIALLSPVLDSMIDPLGTNPASVGLMVSAYTAPAVVMIPVFGLLADRYGRKHILTWCLLLYGVAGTAIALTNRFEVALALRVVQGVGFSGLTPLMITSVGDLYDGTREATAQGLRFTGTGLSQTVLPLVAGFLVVLAWQYPFLLFALAIPSAVLFHLGYDEPAVVQYDESENRRSYRAALGHLLQRRTVLATILSRMLAPVVWIAFLTYNSLIVVRLIGGTPGEAGILVAIGSVTAAIAASQAGRVTNALGSRYYPLVGANLGMVCGFVVVLFAPTVPVAGVGILLAGAGFGMGLSLYRSVITGLASDELRGGLVSVSESGGIGVITLTPVAIGAGIAIAEPTVGFESAVRASGLLVATLSGGFGILFVTIARSATRLE